MILRKYINNSTALQTVNLLKYTTFFLISIILIKTGYSKAHIGAFEFTILLANAVSFFWVYGVIHSLMSLYNNNNSFSSISRNRKSPEIFNAFLLLLGFNVILLLILLVINTFYPFSSGPEKFPFFTIILIYIFFSNPANLVEHIYVLRNRPEKNLLYGFTVNVITLAGVSTALVLKKGVEMALWSLVATSVFRFIWLMFLLKKYALFKVSTVFLKEHFKLSSPLTISYLLSGSAEYIDNLIISLRLSFDSLALFRYGAKELPFSSGLIMGLHSSMISRFTTPETIPNTLALIKVKSKRLMHILFPISIFFLLMANTLYPLIFSKEFGRSSDVFMVYLLLIMSRLLFPQTILIGLKQNKIVLQASLLSIVLNIVLSFLLINHYGVVGVALATIFVYAIEKIVLIWFVYKNHGIKPTEYIPLKAYSIYSVLLVAVFVLIDRGIIQV